MKHSSASLEDHLDEVLSLLELRRDEVNTLGDDAELSLFCGFSSGNGQGGCTFMPELLRRLSALNIPLVLDLYPPNAEEVTEHELST